MSGRIVWAAGCLVFALQAGAHGQVRTQEIGPFLLKDAAVRTALDTVRASEPKTIADQIAICEVPAPPFKEARRAQVYADMLRQTGLRDVRIDREGNVIAERPGRQARPTLVFSAHLDTVFPEGTDVTVKRDGSILRGPGIGDDCRGLAVILAVVRALEAGRIQTASTIVFVATVGEEGLGDLRGVRHLVNESLKGRVDQFVSVDGTGTGITNLGVGSRRFRVTFTGPGGHSFGAFGNVNPAHALGRALARIAEFRVPPSPRTTFNVGRVGGGTSVNAIPEEAWMEIDLRSLEPGPLHALETQLRQAVQQAADEENARWGSRELKISIEVVGSRPAGRSEPGAPIVEAAASVTRALGLSATLAQGSTDANLPMSLGIPALTIDGGGAGSGAHTNEELFDTTESWKGTQRALLLALALARP
jgi:acetylornithine deacetylase/succinyl-diaminopimelate desuccinylase-like protein